MKINMDMIMNMNMNLLSIILYISGIVGILISFLFIVLAIKKNTKTSAVLVMIMFILSIGLLGSGTYFKFLDNKKNPPIVKAEEPSTKNLAAKNQQEPSLDNLRLSYKINSSYDDSKKHATMTIKNTSNAIFNGQVSLSFLNSNKQIVDSVTLQIKNLTPKKSYNPAAIIGSDVSDVDYTFSGDFNDSDQLKVPYTISKISTGDNFALLNISVSDTSKNNLEQICNQLASEYRSPDYKGILIYFYPTNNDSSDNLDFFNAIADYYLNNETKTSKFTYY